MLKHTFLHLPHVRSKAQEREFWNQGFSTWDDLVSGLPSPPDWYLESCQALSRGDSNYFAARLPGSEHWRLAAAYPGETIFVDIETTGFYNSDIVTLIGWSLGGRFQALVPERDSPEPFLQDVRRAKVMVTFN
ncbi:MAG: hypothetical protein LBK52_03255, partial [Deltaproteobacteria bacterium]|nr:hypothetical protein [Deltaproteobacteria bacterium]